MSNFKVGDLCVIVNSGQGNVGKECTIVAVERSPAFPILPGEDCAVEIPGCPSPHPTKLWSKQFRDLRLKRPPSTDDSEPRTEFLPCEPEFLEWWKKVGGKVGA